MSRNTFGFIGLGLIGGSLAISLKKIRPQCRIYAFTRTGSTTRMALENHLIDGILTGPDDPQIRQCDMIFLCAPVSSNIESLSALRKVVSPSCLITDVGSVKTGIHDEVCRQGLQGQFIGGHPMTGSEKSGLANANDHLFENAYYILTPEKDVPASWLEEYKELVTSFLALPLVLDCHEHDYIAAAVSHLPHVIAASLVNTVHNLDSPEEHMKMIAAGGFKDITRIASSSPEMWESICVDNHENISRVMDEFIHLLTAARDEMNRSDGAAIYHMFEESRDYRNSFTDSSHGSIKKNYRIYCDIIDEAGAIATISTILACQSISIKNIGIVHNREFEEGALEVEFYDQQSCDKATKVLEHHRYTVYKT